MNTTLLRLASSLVLFLSVLPGTGPVPSAGWAQSAGQERWKQEFDDVCSRTGDAMSLQPAELKQLIDRCDALRPVIEGLDETQKKVYSKKLKMCRDVFAFALSEKQ